MRILGFILILTLGISNVVLARRLPPKNIPGGLFNLKTFRVPAFTLYCFANLIAFLGIYTGMQSPFTSAVELRGNSLNIHRHQRHCRWRPRKFLVLSREHRQCNLRPWPTCDRGAS